MHILKMLRFDTQDFCKLNSIFKSHSLIIFFILQYSILQNLLKLSSYWSLGMMDKW